MRPLLVLVAALAFPALAAELPSIDTPLRTGLSAKGDAAVVIGVEDYVYLPQATYASQDAQAMYDFLVYTRGLPSARVALLQGGTSRRKIIEAVTTAGKQVGAGGTVWVYFAGHGSASPSTRERLILPENTLADAGDFDEQGVRLAELQRLAGSGGGEVLLITDACFTGAGRAGGTLLSDGRAWVPPQATAVGRSVQWDAAQANQVAGPLAAARHGAFTYFAIGAMRGWADGQVTGGRDGVVTSEEAQLYVQEALRAVGIRDQAPSLVGEGAAARTLASGATERAPALAPMALGPPAAPVALVSSTVSGTSFGSVGAISVDEKLREQACDDDAKTKAGAVRGTRLSALVSAKEAEATAAWETLRPGAEGCAKLEEAGTRAECAAKVEVFVKLAASAQVTLTAGDEVVMTACGARTRVFGAETRGVTVAELGAAKDLAVRLRAAPTLPTAAASAAGGAVSSHSSASSGNDWTSPTVGLMKWIPAGSFTMGSPEGVGNKVLEHPAHPVELTRGFWLMEHEVTQREWMTVMGENPVADSLQWSGGHPQGKCVGIGEDLPVVCVSWEDAQEFVDRLFKRDGVKYRLPTEAEWEYAARGGQPFDFSGGAELEKLGWSRETSGRAVHRGCLKQRNGFGLCDMSGNVREWVADGYQRYTQAPQTNPAGGLAGSGLHLRVSRGGSWYLTADWARVAARLRGEPSERRYDLGLRLARSAP